VIDVDRNIRDARADQAVGKPAIWRIDEFGRTILSVEIRIALRPRDPNVGERLSIRQIPLVFGVPLH